MADANGTGAKRVLFLGAALLLICGYLGWQISRSSKLISLPLYDFVEYWAAGRLCYQGENPYNPDRIEALERAAGRSDDPVIMWNPPWTLPLVMPFGWDRPHLAHFLWLFLQFAALLFCGDVLWRYYGGDPQKRWIAWILTLTFAPSLIALTSGQISPLLLLGATGFLFFQRQQRFALAGIAVCLLAVKPHVVYLFWIALLLWSIQARRWTLLVAGILTGVVMTAIPLAYNSQVISQYWHTFTNRPPSQYLSPTLGAVIRKASGVDDFRLQFLALIPGIAWFAHHWRRTRNNWSWDIQLPYLLFASLLTAAYGAWPFDLVLLLVPLMQCAATLSRTQDTVLISFGLSAHLLISAAAAAVLVAELGYFSFLWMTPAVLIAYLLLMGAARARLSLTQPVSSSVSSEK